MFIIHFEGVNKNLTRPLSYTVTYNSQPINIWITMKCGTVMFLFDDLQHHNFSLNAIIPLNFQILQMFGLSTHTDLNLKDVKHVWLNVCWLSS